MQGGSDPTSKPIKVARAGKSTDAVAARHLRRTVSGSALVDEEEAGYRWGRDREEAAAKEEEATMQRLQTKVSAIQKLQKAVKRETSAKAVKRETSGKRVLSAYESRCTLHVRGVGGKYESAEALKKTFSKFGKFVTATIRHRQDEAGNNTSWALVTMGDVGSAERALHGLSNHSCLRLNLYSGVQAATSKGAMATTLTGHDNHIEGELTKEEREKQELLLLREDRARAKAGRMAGSGYEVEPRGGWHWSSKAPGACSDETPVRQLLAVFSAVCVCPGQSIMNNGLTSIGRALVVAR